MKKVLIFITLLSIFSCKIKEDPNPLIIPPNFAELPDPNNPEKVSKESQEESVARLKELLLESDE